MQDKVFMLVKLPTGTYYGEVINYSNTRDIDVRYAIKVHAYNGFIPHDGIIFAGTSAMTKMEVL